MKRLIISCLGILVALLIIYVYLPLESRRIQDDGKFRYPRPGGEKTRLKASAKVKRDTTFGKIPLYFIPNQGQVNEKAKFYAKTSRYTLWLTKKGVVFDSIKKAEVKAEVEQTHLPHSPHSPKSLERDVSRLIFLNANQNPGMVPVEMTRYKVNYFIGTNPAKWRQGISTSNEVLYKNIYKHIDLKIYGNEGQIEYDWIVNPGGNPGDIGIQYENVKSARIDCEGNLVIETGFGQLIHKKPVSYQFMAGKNIEIKSAFIEIKKNTYGFKVEAYDKKYPLIIDPVVTLIYSTFLGGNGFESGKGIEIDDRGHIYVAGYTDSSDYPLENHYQETYMGNIDGFVTKFAADGTGLVFSTFLGGSSYDYVYDLAVSPAGDVFVTGYTHSFDFPASNTFGGGIHDAFVSRFDSSGNMVNTIYLGGEGLEIAHSVDVDISSYVYVTGSTNSAGFPTKNPYQGEIAGNYDAFITKCDRDLNIVYSTFFGGSGGDFATGLTVGALGDIYIAGHTHSRDFPTKNAYQPYHGGGGSEGFVSKFFSGGPWLAYSTYLGGADTEFVHGIAVDDYSYIYIVGETWGNDFPTQNAFQDAYAGGGDGFIVKLNSRGSPPIYSTYLGGSGSEQIKGVAVDRRGNAFVIGVTTSADFPLAYPCQDTWSKGYDVFVARMALDGTELAYSTYLGGDGDDYGEDITLDDSNNAYITGGTYSAGFPLFNAYQSSLRGGFDAFVSKLAFTYLLWVQSTPFSGAQVTVTPVDVNGNGSGETYFTRTYNAGDVVTLTAPETFKGNAFVKWTIDGKDHNKPVIQVTMNSNHYVKAIYQGTVELSVNPEHLYFGATASGITTGAQLLSIKVSGDPNFQWETVVSETARWLHLPCCGTGSTEMMVSVSFDSSPGTWTHYASILIYGDTALDVTLVEHVGVTLVVYPDNTTAVPFGSFATPGDGTCVYGSIPVTGWALDDIGVESVKIYREEGKNLVYIGDAVFVEGARPDVELAYPTYPNAYRAGWGYMMLTNFLPGGGNGTFVIHAIAADKEGNKVTLGKKTIICDNAHAVRPFGGIDTPVQGGTIHGSSYVNFGWVLTPQPNYIPGDGSTINVWIDGVNVGNPVYNNYRADIAALFPGYANSNGAVGYYTIDTTQYENGVHTIQWTALDSAGNIDGIGSRYFKIKNTAESRVQSVENGTQSARPAAAAGFSVDIAQIPTDYFRPIKIKKGFKENIEYKTIDSNKKQIATIHLKELEHVRIFSAGQGRRDGMGFQLVGERLRPLPIGSTFDRETGIFHWQPGAGFVGTYRFVFIEEKTNREMRKIFVNVEITPRFMKKNK